MESDTTPEKVLEKAETNLKQVRRQMFVLALPLHKKMYPAHRDPVGPILIVTEVLNKIAERHAKPDEYLDAARKDLEETRTFGQSHSLVPPTGHDNLKVIETPEFMRGIYGWGLQSGSGARTRTGGVLLVYADPRRTGRRTASHRSCASTIFTR